MASCFVDKVERHDNKGLLTALPDQARQSPPGRVALEEHVSVVAKPASSTEIRALQSTCGRPAYWPNTCEDCEQTAHSHLTLSARGTVSCFLSGRRPFGSARCRWASAHALRTGSDSSSADGSRDGVR